MCRAKDKENRRCGCDTNEARRLRYGVNIAKRMWSSIVNRTPKPNFLESPTDVTLFTVENIKQEISSLRTFEDPSSATNAALIWHDRKLNLIGAGVEHLAVTKYDAPSDEQLVKAEERSTASFESDREEVKERYQEYKSELLKTGKTVAEAEDTAKKRVIEEMTPETYHHFCSLIHKRNEAYRKALTDVGVKFAMADSFRASADSDKEAVKSMMNAITFYPESWVNLSNKQQDEGIPLKITESPDRGHYTEYYDKSTGSIESAELSLTSDPDFFVGDDKTSVAIHEFAHRASSLVPSIDLSERTFLARRTGHIRIPRPDGSMPKPEKISWIDTDKTEKGFRDNFPLHYMGKIYEDDDGEIIYGGEVFSVGMESLFTGQYGGLSGIEGYNTDPDYKKFILGVLASSAKN